MQQPSPDPGLQLPDARGIWAGCAGDVEQSRGCPLELPEVRRRHCAVTARPSTKTGRETPDNTISALLDSTFRAIKSTGNLPTPFVSPMTVAYIRVHGLIILFVTATLAQIRWKVPLSVHFVVNP
jgi:hypothetical protein